MSKNVLATFVFRYPIQTYKSSMFEQNIESPAWSKKQPTGKALRVIPLDAILFHEIPAFL